VTRTVSCAAQGGAAGQLGGRSGADDGNRRAPSPWFAGQLISLLRDRGEAGLGLVVQLAAWLPLSRAAEGGAADRLSVRSALQQASTPSARHAAMPPFSGQLAS
jgi:hypothetical protein